MRSLAPLTTIALLGIVVTGCGDASKHKSAAASQHISTVAAEDNAHTSTTASATRAAGRSSTSGPYLNDGDHERVGDADGDNNADNDKDRWLDYLPSDYQAHENSRYHDADDRDLLAYGNAASAEEERAVAAVVERYYAMAAAGDGSGACALLLPSLDKAVPSDYGQNGPSYLRPGKTCAAVLTLLFKHYHRQLAPGVAVTSVRIAGDQADALLGSTAFPASFIIVQREGSAWKVAQLLGNENILP
jgi:hypothetical protein